VVVVSHRRGLIGKLDRIALLRNGKIEACGPSSLMVARLAPGAADAARVVAFPAQDSRQVNA
jgi:ABC-type protease/lipase transport system fused ATPase/permease subunit